jgi:hypothetical protein
MPTNEQIFGRFYRHKLMNGPRGQNMRSMIIFMPILGILVAVFAYLSGTSIAISLGIVALVLVYLIFTLAIKPASIFRKKSGAALQTEVTILTEGGINRVVKSEESGMVDSSSVQYSALYSAAETAKDFYLYHAPAQAYMLDKEYFTNGTPEELRAILRTKLGKKFITKQK